ncbi:hypothetical protein [Vreelandella neptunia]|uniref:Exonuclease domain-containing protein n=1 Tax=Vreelandella neptunia TaxID=115551 RepID=A0ABS9SCR4_9GAMM|nr:hypothetical protein [Halomonas neptunia]MCH4813911.1 hypothetical protein [Halomonas neptunia]
MAILPASDLPLITFIDIEASGLGPDSYPIELGWADTLGNGEGFLICPRDEWSHWDPVAASIHGIARDELFERGLHVVDAAKKLNDMLGFETVYCDALDSDLVWISRLFDAAKLEPSFRVSDFYQLHKMLSNEHMLSLRQMLKSLPVLHRAQADAERYAKATVASYTNYGIR